MAWDLGDTVPLTTEVTDASGALAAAAGVVCTVTQPDGTMSTPSVSNPSTGRYTADFVPTQAGRHLERWTSTSPAAARTDQFDVRPAAPGYIISLADAKAHLQLSATSTTFDEELRTWIEATTEVVEAAAGCVIARRTVVERRSMRGFARFALQSIPVISLTSVVDVHGLITWSDMSAFDVDGETGIVDVRLGTVPPCGPITFTYVAGSPIVAARYTGAAKTILRHLWETQRAGVGGPGRRVGAASAEGDTVVIAGYAVPRAAVELIGATGIPSGIA